MSGHITFLVASHGKFLQVYLPRSQCPRALRRTNLPLYTKNNTKSTETNKNINDSLGSDWFMIGLATRRARLLACCSLSIHLELGLISPYCMMYMLNVLLRRAPPRRCLFNILFNVADLVLLLCVRVDVDCFACNTLLWSNFRGDELCRCVVLRIAWFGLRGDVETICCCSPNVTPFDNSVHSEATCIVR